MRIVHITSEMAPVAKVGGLGDVVYGLAKELLRQNQEITVILPKYDFISLPMQKIFDSAWQTLVEDIPVIFLELDAPAIYGDEEKKRFLQFSTVCAKFLREYSLNPDVIHLHDWPTASIASIFKEKYQDSTPIMLTMHNLQYQGQCKESNLLKEGIIYADLLTTVSPTYAKEIQSTEGHGLEPLLKQYQNKLYGILNGIDIQYWNPETDPFLSTNYSKQNVFQGKKENRISLQMEAPLFGCVTRLVHQKGPELILHAIEYILKKGGQFILLGSAIEPKYRQAFEELKERENPNLHLDYTFNEKLAHQIFAAADFILIPSLFEPCGLTQMISLRYGALPIVRETGGLCDTVQEGITGITFKDPTVQHLENALDEAFNLTKDQIHEMVQNGLNQDFSWENSAKKYLKLYQNLTDRD